MTLVKTQEFRLNIKSQVTNLGQVAEFIERAAEACGLGEGDTYNVQMAVDEAVTNIIQHTYRGNQEGLIELCCERQGDDFVIDIRDFGKPFDPAKVHAPRTKGPLSRRSVGGLGIFFMKKLMDEVEFSSVPGKGNRVRMVKRVK